MIGVTLAIAATLGGLRVGFALAERWKLGTLGTLALGWALGMAFAVLMVLCFDTRVT